MAIAFVQGATGTGSSVLPTATLGATPTAGNLLVVAVAVATTESTFVATGWNLLTMASGGTGTSRRAMRLIWKIAGASEPTSPSITLGTSGAWTCQVDEFSGVDGTTTQIGQGCATYSLNLSSTTPAVTPTAGQSALAYFALTSLTATNFSAEALSGSNVGTVTEQHDTAGTGLATAACWALVSSTTGAYTGTATDDGGVGAAGLAFFQASAVAAAFPPPFPPHVLNVYRM